MPVQAEVFYAEMVFLCEGSAPMAGQDVYCPENSDKNVRSVNAGNSKKRHPERGGISHAVAEQGCPFEGLARQEQQAEHNHSDQIVAHAFLISTSNCFQRVHNKITACQQNKCIDGYDRYAQK